MSPDDLSPIQSTMDGTWAVYDGRGGCYVKDLGTEDHALGWIDGYLRGLRDA
jgi:hypothetical protein